MQIGKSPAHKHASLLDVDKNPFPASGLVVEGKVIAINPEDSTVDVALYGGQILRHVRVLFNSANTVAGFRYLASIKNTDAAQNTQNGVVDKAILTHQADTLATIVYVQGQSLAPRVIGFSFPLDAQMHINELGLAMFRHESGVYSLIDITGHHETHYPDGSYVIASSDTTPKTVNWTTPAGSNIDLKIHLTQGVDVTITNKTVTIQAGDASIQIDGNAGKVTATGRTSGTINLVT